MRTKVVISIIFTYFETMPKNCLSHKILTPVRFPSTATSLCTSRGAFLLRRLWAHGDRQASLRQVWTGAIPTHPVHFGKEVPTHVLAGMADVHTPIVCVAVFLLSLL